MAIDTKQPGGNKSDGAAALATAPSAVRREQQFSPVVLDETNDPELNDISTILLGSKAITGKAVTAAGQAGRSVDSVDAHKLADEQKRRNEEQAYRERMNLAAWNAQKTFVGGVEMTNEEAQAARQHIIDNEDEYAARAVREGRIGAGEEDAYKLNNRRIKELNDRIGRGIATDKEKAECEQRTISRLGQASEHDAGEHIIQVRDRQVSATTKNDHADSLLKNDAANSVYGSEFQDAPSVKTVFTQAASPQSAVEQKPEVVATPAAPRVAAMGVSV